MRVHPAALPIEKLLEECEIRRTRRSGPGGQHRNKVETAVVITHRPTGLIAEASERRSQGENREAAIFRLRVRLAVEVRSAVGPDCKPSELWQSRCRGGKIAVNPGHVDFPPLLAESLDCVAGQNYDLKAAAALLGCTPSQLTKFLVLEPKALAAVNQARVNAGMHRIK
jgi:RF-1 domain